MSLPDTQIEPDAKRVKLSAASPSPHGSPAMLPTEASREALPGTQGLSDVKEDHVQKSSQGSIERVSETAQEVEVGITEFVAEQSLRFSGIFKRR